MLTAQRALYNKEVKNENNKEIVFAAHGRFHRSSTKEIEVVYWTDTDKQMEVICKGFVPKNKKSTNWVVKVFEQW